MRILLDTNVLVAAFATRGFCHDILQIVLAQHRLLIGETVLQELEQILADKLGMPKEQVGEVVGFVRERADVVAPVDPAPCPDSDPADRWIAAAAISGMAEILVTGDKDLLEAAPVEGLRSVSPRGPWGLLRVTGGD